MVLFYSATNSLTDLFVYSYVLEVQINQDSFTNYRLKDVKKLILSANKKALSYKSPIALSNIIKSTEISVFQDKILYYYNSSLGSKPKRARGCPLPFIKCLPNNTNLQKALIMYKAHKFGSFSNHLPHLNMTLDLEVQAFV